MRSKGLGPEIHATFPPSFVTPLLQNLVQYFKLANIFSVVGGGGATRTLPRDGGVEKLHGDPTVGPRPKVWARGQKWKKQCRKWRAGEARIRDSQGGDE